MGGGGNKLGRFVQGIFIEGGRKGVIWIPEGRNGRGWRRFAGELRLLISSKVKRLDLEAPLAPSSAGLFTGRSFVEVICKVPGIGGGFLRSPCHRVFSMFFLFGGLPWEGLRWF